MAAMALGSPIVEQRCGDGVENAAFEEPMWLMSARLRAMTWASQAKDAAMAELEGRLRAALEEGNAAAARSRALEAEVREGREREAALKRRAERAEEAEERLAMQMGELEVEAFERITEGDRLVASLNQQQQLEEALSADRTASSPAATITHLSRQLAETEGRLADAELALQAARAQLDQPKMLSDSRQQRVAMESPLKANKLTKPQETMRTNPGDGVPADADKTLISLPLEDLAGIVKLKLWNPSSLTLRKPSPL